MKNQKNLSDPPQGSFGAILTSFATLINSLTDDQWNIQSQYSPYSCDYTSATMNTIVTELESGSCANQLCTLNYDGSPMSRTQAAQFFKNLSNNLDASALQGQFQPSNQNGSNLWANIGQVYNRIFSPCNSYLGEYLFLQVMYNQLGDSNPPVGSLQYLLNAILSAAPTSTTVSDTEYQGLVLFFAIFSKLDPTKTYDATWYTNGGYKTIFSYITIISSLIETSLNECPNFNTTIITQISDILSSFGFVQTKIEKALNSHPAKTQTTYLSIFTFVQALLNELNTPCNDLNSCNTICATLKTDWNDVLSSLNS